MSQGPLCPNLIKKVHREVSQKANRNLPRTMLLGGLSVNLNHLKTLLEILKLLFKVLVPRPFLTLPSTVFLNRC